MIRSIIGGLLVAAILIGCKDDASKSGGKDFIGNRDAPRTLEPRTDVPHGPAVDRFTVDFITDIVFRYQRDGWTLLERSDVTAAKLRGGGVDLFFSAVGTSAAGKPNLEEGIALTHQLVDEAGHDIRIAASFDEVLKNSSAGIVSAMILVEGASELVGASPEQLFDLKKRGVTVVGLVSGRSNALADAAVAPLGKNGGLTSKGAELVDNLREVGIAVDLTHASQRTFYDVLVKEGVLALVSHSAAAALRAHPRNLDDLQILALSRYGSVMGLIFNPDFLVEGTAGATVADVIAHMLHIKKLGAIECLSLGSDFAGIYPPRGLSDIAAYPKLADSMAEAGFSPQEIEAIFGGNAARYFEHISAQHGAAEASGIALLRPIEVECDTIIGEAKGVPASSCDHRVLEDGVALRPGNRQKIRLRDMTRTPVMLEVFGVPNTPWQVEAQSLNGDTLIKRGLLLDENGVGQLPLPENENLTRIFLNPTRPSTLREVVIWGE
ncbi:MAG: membrane dipeptidase [Deltaproteobacteria bacterium]|nr:membrane dipeptidase [Deltaproteobacteria bacterium]MBN2670927.1 membrane dipeptidase [Deltaproteobacteria bacterium]